MTTSRTRITCICGLILSVLGTVVVVGCASKKQPPTASSSSAAGASSAIVQTTDGVLADPQTATNTPGEESLSSAELLARKTESYANSMSTLMTDQQPPTNPLETPPASVTQSEVVITDIPVEQPGSDIRGERAVASAPAASVSKEAVLREPPVAEHRTTAHASQTPPSVNSARDAWASLAPTAAAAPQANVAKQDVTDTAVPAAATPTSGAPSPGLPAGQTLEATLAQRVKDDPLDPIAHLDYELLRFIKGEPTPDMSSLSSLPQEDQQVLSAVLDGLSNYRGLIQAEPNPLLGRKIKPLLDMADRLGVAADLNIPKIAICHEVKAFGVYEPMEPARFIAQKDGEYSALIYCEIANFSSQINERGIWETKLRYSASLFTDTENSVEVWQGTPAEVHDLCRNKRQDFFIWERVALPSSLTIGGYLFKVSIVDEQANRVAEATVPIQIVAR